ncbi:MAG: DUF6522 family protein [Rhodospirillales bacterium]
MTTSGVARNTAAETSGRGNQAAVVTQPFPAAITRFDDGYVVAAEMVAPQLGLAPDAFWREMRRGIVYGVVERGEDEDAGRTRLTFRYRARSWSIIVEEAIVKEALR